MAIWFGRLPKIPLTAKGARNCRVKRSILSGDERLAESWTETNLDKIDNLGQISEFLVIPLYSVCEPSVKSPRGED